MRTSTVAVVRQQTLILMVFAGRWMLAGRPTHGAPAEDVDVEVVD